MDGIRQGVSQVEIALAPGHARSVGYSTTTDWNFHRTGPGTDVHAGCAAVTFRAVGRRDRPPVGREGRVLPRPRGRCTTLRRDRPPPARRLAAVHVAIRPARAARPALAVSDIR